MTRSHGTACLSRWGMRLLASALALASLSILTGCESRRDGTALLRNATDQAPLEIVLHDSTGQRNGGGTFEKVYVFDTQFTDRDRQCLVGRDGGFEVFGPDGEVIASHQFHDRPLCELEELVLQDDGSLVWE